MDTGIWTVRCQSCRQTFDVELKPTERIIQYAQKETCPEPKHWRPGITSSVFAPRIQIKIQIESLPEYGIILNRARRLLTWGMQRVVQFRQDFSESILSLLVEGFEMSDHLMCHFERSARNLF
jgi:hypothetical protein